MQIKIDMPIKNGSRTKTPLYLTSNDYGRLRIADSKNIYGNPGVLHLHHFGEIFYTAEGGDLFHSISCKSDQDISIKEVGLRAKIGQCTDSKSDLKKIPFWLRLGFHIMVLRGPFDKEGYCDHYDTYIHTPYEEIDRKTMNRSSVAYHYRFLHVPLPVYVCDWRIETVETVMENGFTLRVLDTKEKRHFSKKAASLSKMMRGHDISVNPYLIDKILQHFDVAPKKTNETVS